MIVMVKEEDLARKVILLESEIRMIVEELERVPHNTFEFFNYGKIIQKLKSETEKKKPVKKKNEKRNKRK
jgi:hypothetical protein